MSAFRHITGKLGNMRKAVEWTVYPRQDASDEDWIIQSERRIAKVNADGEAVVSNGKGGHQGFHKLIPALGAISCQCPADMLKQLKALAVPVGPVRLV